LTVHDPFLTDRGEAERRARMRLNLSKDYGRQLEIIMALEDFEDLGIDLGDTVRADLPKLGLSEDMIVFGIEYDLKSLKVKLILGGRQQLYEEFLAEQIGGDVAARFGRAMTLPEQTSTLAYSLDKIARIQADQKHVIYVNKPPITFYNAQNVILNSNGEVELVSGATEGSFEARVLPPSQLFINWIKAEWMAEKGEKTVPGSSEDWPSSLTDWSYRKKITIRENAGQNLTDYQIKLVIHYGSGTDSGSDIYLNGKCKTDFGDIRFADADGGLLAYWMEEKVDSDYAVFWVKVPSIPANGAADIYIYYGNLGAVYDGAPHQVFDFYDDFNDDDMASYWVKADVMDPSSHNFVEQNQRMEDQYVDQGYAVLIENAVGFDYGFVLEAKTFVHKGGAENPWGGFYIGQSNHGYYIECNSRRSGIREWINTTQKEPNAYGPDKITLDEWHDVKIVRRWDGAENAFEMEVDGIAWDLGDYSNLDLSINPVYVGLVSTHYPGNYRYWDDIRVRKYVDPEPSISAIGGEEYYLQETTTVAGSISAQFLNADGEILGQVYDAYDTRFYRFRKWPQGYGSFTYRNASKFGASNASASDARMGILHAYCLKLTPSTFGSDGEIYYPSGKNLNLDLSWAKWLRLYLYADYESDVTVKIRLHQDASNYFEGSLVVKAKEWRKYEIAISSLSKIGDPSLSNINWISIISPYPILIDSDHVFLPATRELLRVKFTLKRDSPDDPSPRVKLVKLIWREGA